MGILYIFIVVFVTVVNPADLKNRKIEGRIKYHGSIPDPTPEGSCLIVKLAVYKNDKTEAKLITKHVIYNHKKGYPSKYSMEFPDVDISENDLYNLVVSAVENIGWCSDGNTTPEAKVVRDQDFHTTTLTGVLPDKIIATSDIIVEGPEITLEPGRHTDAVLDNYITKKLNTDK